MRLLDIFAAGMASLLVVSAFTTQTSSPSPSELVRRHHEHGTFTNIYIMRQGLDYSNGSLPVHNPDGSVAFLFDKVMRDYKNGISSTVVMNRNSNPLLQLKSQGDICKRKSYYIEPDVAGATHTRVEIDPRFWKADRWYFSFVAPSGEQFSYVFKRHYWDKGGEIFRERKGENDQEVAKLENQVRWEPWLTPRSTGTHTYTLSCTADSPVVGLVALMGLIMTRVHDCGL
ncbi:hypothetical protein PTTG_25324 [Puccinia triticina 1-1 BBBD Race 1]|uniref:Uncharacterized protein n=2 Tax=Puccinia triticina TaxID=208348 RepID=A0A180H3R9_PUCT1|nr:uncharacterized protein PtA15_8A521 [Puccinia triticina]OAV99249.1 hypothetical protein PTTG_25324 [Puccinia triticina 1-1 BBBD Race 1]WAQ87616.1 hypothetical protein PtA15_8A521 [Puccinia triticina]WAR57471.1 hypothetical protein PtB15_8B520 [Puccinia triticina]